MNAGGVERWLLNVLRYIDASHVQLEICTFGPEPGLYANDVEQLGGKMVPCPIGRNLWSFRNRFRQILRQGNYDVVHSHVTFFSGAVLHWAKVCGVPGRIAHCHTSYDERPQTMGRRVYRTMMRSAILRFASHGLAVSRLAARELFGPGWEKDGRFAILHCGIDLKPFEADTSLDRNSIRKELGIPEGARVIGHVGRFDVQKNHVFLVEIARATCERDRNVHFLCLGGGSLRSKIERQCRDMGLSDRVHFAGVRDDVPRLMKAAMDLFVLPSLWEGLPLVLIEAQAAGLFCVFSSEITAEATILADHCAQIPLSQGLEPWVQAVFRAFDLHRDRDHESARKVAQTDFNIERSSQELLNVYARAAG